MRCNVKHTFDCIQDLRTYSPCQHDHRRKNLCASVPLWQKIFVTFVPSCLCVFVLNSPPHTRPYSRLPRPIPGYTQRMTALPLLPFPAAARQTGGIPPPALSILCLYACRTHGAFQDVQGFFGDFAEKTLCASVPLWQNPFVPLCLCVFVIPKTPRPFAFSRDIGYRTG